MKHTIRRLNMGEADLYRHVRLESLKESPEAFAASYESALSRDYDSWAVQADASASGRDRATFIVLGDQPIGLAALYRDQSFPHEGELIQVWVSPCCRGSRTAIDLMDTIFNWASCHGFASIRAEVAHHNLRALRFYEKYGFVGITGAGESVCILTKGVEGSEGLLSSANCNATTNKDR